MPRIVQSCQGISPFEVKYYFQVCQMLVDNTNVIWKLGSDVTKTIGLGRGFCKEEEDWALEKEDCAERPTDAKPARQA